MAKNPDPWLVFVAFIIVGSGIGMLFDEVAAGSMWDLGFLASII